MEHLIVELQNSSLFLVLKVSHLVCASTSANGMSLGKMILATLQCNLSSASKLSNGVSPFLFRYCLSRTV